MRTGKLVRKYLQAIAVILAGTLTGCGDGSSHPGTDIENIALADIRYTLAPNLTKDGSNSVDVTLKFKGEMDGVTQLMVGGKWGGVENSRQRFRDLSIEGEDIVLPKNLNKYILDVGHKPGHEVTVSYRLSEADMRDAATNIEYFYTPVLNDDVIHLIGTHALVIPFRDNKDDKFSVSLTWENLPAGWKTIDTLPGEDIYSRWIGQQVVAAAPSHYIHRDGPLTILKVDAHDFEQDAFNERIGDGFNALTRLWGTEEQDYLVSLLGTLDSWDHGSFTGTGRFNSFASAASRDFALNDIGPVLIHEITHHWIPGQLGNAEVCQTDNPSDCPPSVKWFSEGFTDFVAVQVMISEGHWDRRDLVAFTNAYLRDYYISPARNATGKAIDKLFWQDFEHERQPYWRGFLIAMNWDAETLTFTKGSASTISALQSLREAAANSEDNRPILTAEYIAENFSHQRPRIEDIERYYVKGETIEIRPDLFPDCADLKVEPIQSYDVGFDPDATLSTGIVTSVQSDHNAFKAGLRNRQTLIAKVSGGGGETSAPLVLEVKDRDTVKTISYIPVGGEPIMVPQFEITGDCSANYIYGE